MNKVKILSDFFRNYDDGKIELKTVFKKNHNDIIEVYGISDDNKIFLFDMIKSNNDCTTNYYLLKDIYEIIEKSIK
jgi:hypothetical protein